MNTARPLSRIDATLKAALLIAIIAVLFWLALDVFLIIFAGLLLAVVLSGASDWVTRRTGLPYGLALAAVLLASILTVGVVGAVTAPALWAQFGDITQRLPEAVNQLTETVRQLPGGTYLVEKAPE